MASIVTRLASRTLATPRREEKMEISDRPAKALSVSATRAASSPASGSPGDVRRSAQARSAFRRDRRNDEHRRNGRETAAHPLEERGNQGAGERRSQRDGEARNRLEEEGGNRQGARAKQYDEYVSWQKAQVGVADGVYMIFDREDVFLSSIIKGRGFLELDNSAVFLAVCRAYSASTIASFGAELWTRSLSATLPTQPLAPHYLKIVAQFERTSSNDPAVTSSGKLGAFSTAREHFLLRHDALSEAACLDLVREGKLLRTAKVVFVDTRTLTPDEKAHLVPPLVMEEEEKETNKKEEEHALRRAEFRGDAEVALDGRSQGGNAEVAHVAATPAWTHRKLLHNRTFICTLRGNHANSRILPEDDTTVFPNDTLLRAIPLDKRISWILVPLREAQKWESLPGLLDKQRLYLVNIDVWDAFSVLPRGSILTYIGPADSVKTIERCCMLQNDLQTHTLPHSAEALAETDEIVRQAEESFEAEAKRRVDLRGARRIFTIDPASARDLDDAVHVHRLPPRAWTAKAPEFEIGVHIADVGHFLRPLCRTDEEARERCTAVYLTHVVFPMLPRALCDSLCSLHLGSPKLTFSVTFRVRKDGSLVKAWRPRFYKSVQVLIDGGDFPPDARPPLASPCASSASLTLGTCGCFVAVSSRASSSRSPASLGRSADASPASRASPEPPAEAGNGEGSPSSFPFAPRAQVLEKCICCGRCTACCECGRDAATTRKDDEGGKDQLPEEGERTPTKEKGDERSGVDVSWKAVVEDLKLLDTLTVGIRKKRFANGSLLLHKATLRFAVDARSRPTGWHLEEHSRSHTLIEELMLLANCLVAERLIASPFSDLSVLRLHPPLLDKQIKSLKAFLSKMEIATDFSSSKATQKTLEDTRKTNGDCAAVAVEALLRKALKLAMYYVHGDTLQPHFALHFDEYTHFTSPIRRYADVLVHRLLACILEWEWRDQTKPPLSAPSSSVSPRGRVGKGEESPALAAFRKNVETICGDKDQLEGLCGQCNAKKMNAKQAQTDCDRFFLAIHLKHRKQPEATVGVVLMLQDRSLVVFLPLLDKEQRIAFQTEDAREQALHSVDTSIQKSVTLPLRFHRASPTEAFSAAPVHVVPTNSVPADFMLTLISPFSPDYARVKARENEAFSFFLAGSMNQRLLLQDSQLSLLSILRPIVSGAEMLGMTESVCASETHERS
ncbi:putative RNB-like protein domain containing protein [Neospora caninum Liverpool]|uniref:Putative RNB-like protein domain containing protein n=1 Tax=Neospora caninum (strain Liverpool) TaxID=572307 RepID=F0VDM5_NEOCL|nr:putative RNB-like protein domain containing protein [Neospora caninum Liverpool]CBZ51818.1 putative RNB-like protein domain containing protein [Neospora caninum Liverpool]|eukprot:XP_003881851.1 putative RNB-like protein domain containing protein [Neospora caninum Liverpool]